MATSTSTATQNETPLRKRTRVLERTLSPTNLNPAGPTVSKPLPLSDFKLKQREHTDDMVSSPRTDDEDDSDSSSNDDDEEQRHREAESSRRKEHEKPSRPSIDTKGTYASRHHWEHDSMSPKTRAWYEFDLAVVVALVSPIGNWLTGGDHVKNLLLIVLLIFYLHQVIEIPWTLYQKCRPRKRAHHLPPSGAFADDNSQEARYARLAASELQKFEFLFLLFTFISPFLGAALLRYATDAVLGPDAVSWFSTGLFVLATGMRPWLHIVERLSERTSELHDFVHYPSTTHGVSEEQYKILESRLQQLEKSLTRIQGKVNSATDGVYEYVDDAVEAVEHAMRKQERKWDKYEGKVKEVEQVVVQLSSKSLNQSENLRTALSSCDLQHLKSYTRYIIERIIPNWLLTSPQKVSAFYSSLPDERSSNVLIGTPINSSRTYRRSLSLSASPSPSPTPLETIVEEETNTFYKQTPVDKISLIAQPYKFTSTLVFRAGYILTAPLRAVIRMVLRNY